MKRFILAGAVGLFTLQHISAQNFQIQPTPQQYVTLQDSLEIPLQVSLITDKSYENLPAVSLVENLWKGQIKENGFPIYLGIQGDKLVKKYKKNIPNKSEGYYLSIEKDKIIVAGADEQGLFYGIQTLAQLLTLPKLPLVQVTDYPDLPYRGVVEGFYGTPWSQDARLRQLEFYGKNKLNVYLYGPKDDPYHSTPNWRKPYPPQEAAQLKAEGQGFDPNSQEVADLMENIPPCTVPVQGPTVVVLSSDQMGTGDEVLGRALMKGFVYALTQLDEAPDTVLLYNGGAKLSVEGAETVADLKTLEEAGAEILTCGTCLNHYGLTEKLAVGSVTNMYVIAETMAKAGKVIRP